MLLQKEGGCVRSALLGIEIRRSKDLVSDHSSYTVRPKGSSFLFSVFSDSRD